MSCCTAMTALPSSSASPLIASRWTAMPAKLVILSSQQIRHLLIPVHPRSQRVRDNCNSFSELRQAALYLMHALQMVTSMTDALPVVGTPMRINPAMPLQAD